MPFTLSHPAAVLPLVSRLGPYGVGSALAVGSVTPDLPYFLGLPLARETTHSLAGLVGWTLPVGLAAWLVLQHLLKAPALFLLPRPLRERIDPAPAPLRMLPVAVSLLLGAATHVLWDAITHETGHVARSAPLLGALVSRVGGAEGVYHVLQHGSTLLGAAALALWIAAWVRRTPPRAVPSPAALPRAWRRPLRAALLLLPPLLGVGMAVLGVGAPAPRSFGGFVVHAVVATLSLLGAGLVAVGVLARVRRVEAG